MQNQIDQKHKEPWRKRAIHNDYSSKSKVTSGTQDHIDDIFDGQSRHE